MITFFIKYFKGMRWSFVNSDILVKPSYVIKKLIFSALP